MPVGGGGAWPGFETTRRAKLAARTARGRAAAHRHTQRPGPQDRKHSGRALRRPEHQRRNTTCPVGSHDCRSAKKLAQHRPSSGISVKKLAQRAIKRQFGVIFPALGELFRVSTSFAPRRANFFTLAHTPGQAGRKTSRTRRDNMARLKPTTPLLTPNKGPLKPTSPLHPKNAPDKPISRPQGRCRFHSHTDTSKQRR